MKRENLVKGNMYYDKRDAEQSIEKPSTMVYVGKSDLGYKFRIDYAHSLSKFIDYTASDLPFIRELV